MGAHKSLFLPSFHVLIKKMIDVSKKLSAKWPKCPSKGGNQLKAHFFDSASEFYSLLFISPYLIGPLPFWAK